MLAALFFFADAAFSMPIRGIVKAGKENLEKEIRERQQEYRSLKENSRKARETLQGFQAEKERIASSIETFEVQQKEIGEIPEAEIREQRAQASERKKDLAEERKELFSIQKGNQNMKFSTRFVSAGGNDNSGKGICMDQESF